MEAVYWLAPDDGALMIADEIFLHPMRLEWRRPGWNDHWVSVGFVLWLQVKRRQADSKGTR